MKLKKSSHREWVAAVLYPEQSQAVTLPCPFAPLPMLV